VIWVPDDYPTIQGGILASSNGDTVRVRRGVYHESLQMLNKNIWLESEEGPEVTIVEPDSLGFGIVVNGGQSTTAGIRGFIFLHPIVDGILTMDMSSPTIVNNIVINAERHSYYAWNFTASFIRNNVFKSPLKSNLDLLQHYGVIENNMILYSPTNYWALWNAFVYENPIQPDYNCIWDYDKLTNDPPIRLGSHNLINVDPELEERSFRLKNGSPCIDAGNPDLFDPDGSRSDIGVYGGPFAYPPPE